MRSRALTIFVSIVLLFLMGILVGGIRIMDAPGWGEYGYMSQLVRHGTDRNVTMIHVDPASEDEVVHPRDGNVYLGTALLNEPLSELGNKPWFVGQILCGPMTLMASAASAHAAHPKIDPQTGEVASTSIPGIGVKAIEGTPVSHSRSWEIGALYTAVAGMLNLLAIIDSTFRAGHSGQHDEKPETRAGRSEAA
jgi:hypothetical protein